MSPPPSPSAPPPPDITFENGSGETVTVPRAECVRGTECFQVTLVQKARAMFGGAV